MPNPAIQPLTQLIEEFLSGIVDPVFFEREFFNVFYVSSQLGWTSVESKILHDFFWAVEDFVANPDLRDSPEDLDEPQLRSEAARALQALRSLPD